VNLSPVALRIYEILKRYEYKKTVVLDVDSQLRKWLGLTSKYTRYNDFKHRILIPAQKQLSQYTDIAFTFHPHKRKGLGGKVIALEFKIKENTPTRPAETAKKLTDFSLDKYISVVGIENESKNVLNSEERATTFTWSQIKAIEYLQEKGIGKRFTIHKILGETKVQYEPLQGFEDIYVRKVWGFFEQKTRSNNLAPTFITWWKNGKLTEDGLHAGFIEQVIKYKKGLSNQQRMLRKKVKTLTHSEFLEWKKMEKAMQQTTNKPPETATQKMHRTIKPVVKKSMQASHLYKNGDFDFEQFKINHPLIYGAIRGRVIEELKQKYGEYNVDFDEYKLAKVIEERVKSKCRKWLDD
jgi:hypothetical protein